MYCKNTKYGTVQYCTILFWYDAEPYRTVRYSTVLSGTVRYGTYSTWYGNIRDGEENINQYCNN